MGPEGETWFENVKQEADLWGKKRSNQQTYKTERGGFSSH